jgi:UDP-glucuronate decarboxylase
VTTYCSDNFFTGSKENIQHHIGKKNFEVIRHDVVGLYTFNAVDP